MKLLLPIIKRIISVAIVLLGMALLVLAVTCKAVFIALVLTGACFCVGILSCIVHDEFLS